MKNRIVKTHYRSLEIKYPIPAGLGHIIITKPKNTKNNDPSVPCLDLIYNNKKYIYLYYYPVGKYYCYSLKQIAEYEFKCTTIIRRFYFGYKKRGIPKKKGWDAIKIADYTYKELSQFKIDFNLPI